MEKTSKWLSFDFDSADFQENDSKKLKLTPELKTNTSDGVFGKELSRVQTVDTSVSGDWLNTFSPKSVSDLCIHNKKVQEVEQWLKTSSANHQSSILLLTGPSGSGKTITIQLLANHLKLNVCEWITPIDQSDFSVNYEYGKLDALPKKQSNKFYEFILKSSCFTSLLSNSRRIVLVEDFPNVFLRKPSEFHDILQRFNDRGKSPIVFICTETKEESLNLIRTLFPQTIRDRCNIENITFNAISTTGLKSALKRIVTIMSKQYSSMYNTPSEDLIDCVINSSLGDVRSAVLNLHFASLKGVSMPQISGEYKQNPAKSNSTKGGKAREKKTSKSNKFNTLGKMESITIMHGVGRVLNPKIIESSTANDQKKLSHSPNVIVEQFSIQPNIFLGFLHENYLSHFSNILCTWRAAAAISDADYFMNEWREKDGKIYGMHMCVGGLMLANKSPASAWNPVHGPKNMKIQYPSFKLDLDNDFQFIQGKVLATDYKTFYEIITKHNQNPAS